MGGRECTPFSFRSFEFEVPLREACQYKDAKTGYTDLGTVG